MADFMHTVSLLPSTTKAIFLREISCFDSNLVPLLSNSSLQVLTANFYGCDIAHSRGGFLRQRLIPPWDAVCPEGPLISGFFCALIEARVRYEILLTVLVAFGLI
ncbi:hypothetical protein CEXT_460231 [Caerostris extrusa]|uniref:Uncharacterized protein n=1 Tax=Caerostris extrusa TaxID=172846 RepID=A0AAV4WDP1_CAEEX|nr:hypothetical protein CEXT_460231 [Caerostris extrusa]